MFRSKTVFVIGAGASKEAGLPTGPELRAAIASKLDIKFKFGIDQISGDEAIYNALRLYARNSGEDVNLYLQEAWKINEALPQAMSIDNYIDTHRGNGRLELCGKLAIAQSILQAEADSLLYFADYEQETFSPTKLATTWYEPFLQILTEAVRVDDLESIF